MTVTRHEHLKQVEAIYREWARGYYKHSPEVIDQCQCALEYMRMYEKTEFVRSHYQAPWYGVVYKREKRKGAEDLLTVQVLKDRRGNWIRKPFYKTLSEHWLTPINGWIMPKSPWSYSPHSDWTGISETRRQVKARRARVKSIKRQLRGLE